MRCQFFKSFNSWIPGCKQLSFPLYQLSCSYNGRFQYTDRPTLEADCFKHGYIVCRAIQKWEALCNVYIIYNVLSLFPFSVFLSIQQTIFLPVFVLKAFELLFDKFSLTINTCGVMLTYLRYITRDILFHLVYSPILTYGIQIKPNASLIILKG